MPARARNRSGLSAVSMPRNTANAAKYKSSNALHEHQRKYSGFTTLEDTRKTNEYGHMHVRI